MTMPERKGPLTLLLALFLAIYINHADGLAVMSVDLGSEFMKIAIVKPGVPMEIAYNEESKRKTPVVITMRNGERLIGDGALTTSVRYPKAAFKFLNDLLAKPLDNPLVQQYQRRFPDATLEQDEQMNTVVFRHEGETYSPEELLAMVLEKAKDIASTFAEQPVKEAVITVPAYFNQAERKSVMRAADLVGLKVLQLMNDNSAVALNYGVFRRKSFNSTTQYYMFYDMGSTSTTATVAAYQVVKTKEGTIVETNPQVTIKGVGYDRSLGGVEFQLRLQKHLAKLFNEQKKTPQDVTEIPRSMAKLFKEAGRLKTVLSANTEHYAQVESLVEDIDFRAKVTRDEYEEMCKDLMERVSKPIKDAMDAAEISMEMINEVILMGAGTRVPKVQEKILAEIKREDLGKSINTDEAAALGAVYQAAHLSKGFKVLKFLVKEANMFPIQVEFERTKVDDDGKESTKTVKRTLFGRWNPFPQKKVMTFNKHTTDFTFDVNYGDLSFLSETELKTFGDLELNKVSLAGVADAHTKYGKDAESKGVKAHFKMDESGILVLDKVEFQFEKQPSPEDDQSTLSKLGNTISNFFSGSTDEKPSEDVKEGEAKEGEAKEGEAKEGEKKEATEDQKKETDDETKETPEKEGKSDEETKQEGDKTEADGDKEETKNGEKKKKANGEKYDSREGKKDKKGKKGDKDKKEEKEEEKKPPKPQTIKEPIEAKTEHRGLPEPSEDKIQSMKKKIDDMRKKDEEKRLLEIAKNELESYIFTYQDKLYQEDYEKCSTEEERSVLSGKLSEASDWLYEQEDSVPTQDYKDKLKSLQKAMKDVILRVKEVSERPAALDALKSMLNYSVHFKEGMKNFTAGMTEGDEIFTEVEFNTLAKLVNETTAWREEQLALQEKTPLYEKPVILIEDIATKVQALDREVKYLVSKAKYYKPKPKPKEETKASNTTTNTTSEDTGTKKVKDDKKDKKKEEDDDEDVQVEVENGDEPVTEEPINTETKNTESNTESTKTEEQSDNKKEKESSDKSDNDEKSEKVETEETKHGHGENGLDDEL
ncbi:unnamed protein product [Owenia fusiformis]|uniref:Hypoxia up-regulated protein 1 n=1 Tax=Owenia fusiformis TaxID=6347 RepID=A0A8J1TW02_OWEFU|nr:unnamed protein product [Owenia fusiformis]